MAGLSYNILVLFYSLSINFVVNKIKGLGSKGNYKISKILCQFVWEWDQIFVPFSLQYCPINFPASQQQKNIFWMFCLVVRPMLGVENTIFIVSGVKKQVTYLLFLLKQFIFLGELQSQILSKLLLIYWFFWKINS